MEREKSSLYLGLGLLIAGIVVLGFVFATVIGVAANPGTFLRTQLSGSTRAAAPVAAFIWSSNGTTVHLEDMSSSGSATISTYEWTFGDGQQGNQRDPEHVYASPGSYTVRLTVRDANGLQASAGAGVNVQTGSGNSGRSESGQGFDINVGDVAVPIAIATLTFGMWTVGFLVGGSLVKAGWNLIRPRPETIRIRLKPQNLEPYASAEVVPPGAMGMPSPPPMTPPPPPAP